MKTKKLYNKSKKKKDSSSLFKRDQLVESFFEERLRKLYKDGFSMKEISEKTGHSYGRVVYWMRKMNVPRRSWSDATYLKRNPKGEPFKIKRNLNKEDLELRGLGLGLYWGEGNKKNKYSVRLGNTDAKLIIKFRKFLLDICGVEKGKIKYTLQVFNDVDPQKALIFWSRELGISKKKIGKVSIIPPSGKGTYKNKNQHGVLTIYVHNTKLKKIVDSWIKEQHMPR